MFSIITGLNESETLTKHNHVNVNVNFMKQNIIQINDRIKINVDASVRNILYVKKVMFGILLHVIVKTENIWQVLWMIQRLSVMKL